MQDYINVNMHTGARTHTLHIYTQNCTHIDLQNSAIIIESVSWLQAGFGSRRLSCMLARYPGGGARYARHRDALPTAEKGAGRRRLTAVYYLNHGWTPEARQ